MSPPVSGTRFWSALVTRGYHLPVTRGAVSQYSGQELQVTSSGGLLPGANAKVSKKHHKMHKLRIARLRTDYVCNFRFFKMPKH